MNSKDEHSERSKYTQDGIATSPRKEIGPRSGNRWVEFWNVEVEGQY